MIGDTQWCDRVRGAALWIGIAVCAVVIVWIVAAR